MLKNLWYKAGVLFTLGLMSFSAWAVPADPFGAGNQVGAKSGAATVQDAGNLGTMALNVMLIFFQIVGAYTVYAGLSQVSKHFKDKRNAEGTIMGGFGMCIIGIAMVVIPQLIKKYASVL